MWYKIYINGSEERWNFLVEDIEKKDKRTILVVDDEKPIVEILVYNLQK